MFKCQKCGKEVEVVFDKNTLEKTVEPCQYCNEVYFEKGFEEGWAERSKMKRSKEIQLDLF